MDGHDIVLVSVLDCHDIVLESVMDCHDIVLVSVPYCLIVKSRASSPMPSTRLVPKRLTLQDLSQSQYEASKPALPGGVAGPDTLVCCKEATCLT